MNTVDLHLHSTASDGVWRPAAVVQLAKERGLTTIALTDHDTTAGLREAIETGQALGLEVIGGLEINSETDFVAKTDEFRKKTRLNPNAGLGRPIQ